MKRTFRIFFALAVFGFAACNNSNQENISYDKKISIDSDTTQKAFEEAEKDIDSIIFDYSSFPMDSNFTTKVLTVGTFHSDEIWENTATQTWYGLFKNEMKYYVAETKLITDRIYDAVLDEDESEKTGWSVQTENKDTSLILIEAGNHIDPCNVEHVVLIKKEIFPGDTLRINYLGIDYEIVATGNKKRISTDTDWFEVSNYKLYVNAIFNGQQRSSLLVAHPSFDDQMVKLIFAGDIDGDRVLDLIIDTSNHYNASSPTLYLSSPSNETELLKPVGGHTSVGC